MGPDTFAVARIGWIAKGLVFVIIGFLGLELARQNYGAENADQGGALALIAGAPADRVLVLAVGVGTIGVGVYQLWRGFQGGFLEDIETGDLSATKRRALGGLGGTGMVARAVMLGIAGALFILAAWRYDPDEAAGLDQSLRTIAEGPFGRGLLALAALGLMAAGVYDMVTFMRQRID